MVYESIVDQRALVKQVPYKPKIVFVQGMDPFNLTWGH